jgi:pyridoxine 4-dehydrogenase
LIRHIGLSNISPSQFAEGDKIAKIVCVQNHYNLAHRQDDPLIADLAGKGIAFVPFFPLGGFRPLQSPILDEAAAALAWLLQRSPNVLIIAGTSSTAHLRENLKAATLQLPPETVARLDEIASFRVCYRIHAGIKFFHHAGMEPGSDVRSCCSQT